MMLACFINTGKYEVSLYEKNAALGRKFLVAGKGGFNLTHSEDLMQFADRYYPKEFFEPFLEHFSNRDFRNWLTTIGIETYVGSSKRVFPVKGIKPIEVLKAIEKKLMENKVPVFYNHEWKGWDEANLVFENKDHRSIVTPDIAIFALGGASWKVTGSSGTWTNYFKEKNITLNPFYPSNCAHKIGWDEAFIKKYAGQALKNCEFKCGNVIKKGEAVVTEFGIEGSGIYPLSKALRDQLIASGSAKLSIDLKPDLNAEDIKLRLENRGNSSIKNVLEKKLNLTPGQIELLKLNTTKEEYNNVTALTAFIKSLTLTVTGFAPIDEAISTVGGVVINELTKDLELKKLPQHFCIGEMIDWDAPTGGYLLQACFSMGYSLAGYLNKRP